MSSHVQMGWRPHNKQSQDMASLLRLSVTFRTLRTRTLRTSKVVSLVEDGTCNSQRLLVLKDSDY